jgi:hypothetical protein
LETKKYEADGKVASWKPRYEIISFERSHIFHERDEQTIFAAQPPAQTTPPAREGIYVKGRLSMDNITRGGGWFASRYAFQEASTSAPGGIRGPSLFDFPSNVGGDMVPKTTPENPLMNCEDPHQC